MNLHAKFLTVALAAVMCLSLAACGGNSKSDNSDTENNTSAPDGNNQTEPNADEQSDIDAQLALIAENKSLWFDTTLSDVYSFAVTDLDRNGRLELISSSCQGTGLYSYNTVWEVNEARDGLEQCSEELAEGDSQADLSFVTTTVCYYDPSLLLYHYIFTDTIKNGAAEYYENTRAITLDSGVLTDQYLANKSTVYTAADEEPTVSCTDPDGNEITQEQYDTAAATAYEGLEASTVEFNWLTTAETDFESIDTDALTELLRSSYDAFSK